MPGAARRLRWTIQDQWLTLEERLGRLGPAHRRWSGNSFTENRRRWNEWDWSRQDEEWNASAERKASLIENVLERWIPMGASVLEIGPGAGRWSESWSRGPAA